MNDKDIKQEYLNASWFEKLLISAREKANRQADLYKFPKHLKFKEFKPKYNSLELMYDCEGDTIDGKFIPKVVRYDKMVKRFGDREVISYIDYEDTKTTSVRLSKEIN